MTTPSFPHSYARIQFTGYGEQRESGLLRTQMESGPPKQARVKSRVMKRRSVVILLRSKSDYASFLTWFGTTLEQGSQWFDLTDPVTGSTVSARFADGELNATPLGSTQRWQIRAVIESWVS